MFARHVGRNIRRARQAAGFSKIEPADRAGIHWTVLVSYEAGSGIPILETFVRIAWALGVPPASLLPGLDWEPLESEGYTLKRAQARKCSAQAPAC